MMSQLFYLDLCLTRDGEETGIPDFLWSICRFLNKEGIVNSIGYTVRK